MIKSSGGYCDVCELPIMFGTVHCFGMPGLKNTLHSCNECKKYFEPGMTVDDWPNGEVKRQIIKLAKVDRSSDGQ